MFTGIVQGKCVVKRVTDGSCRQLQIQLNELAEGLEIGGSVAINGTCLTAVSVNAGVVSFDVIQETLTRTNLKDVKEGAWVNVERSARFGDEIGGHPVSGHIHGVGKILRIDRTNGQVTLTCEVPEDCRSYLFHKGFVALNGASLTISAFDRATGELSVSLIPETLRVTNIGEARVGDQLNLEIDATTQAIVETVRAVLAEQSRLA